MEIDWKREFDGRERRFERYVACVLSNEHPDIRRIDGSGGDGGRDCYRFSADETVADYFQVKCVFGRLSGGGRKQQIKKSFKRAMNNDVRPTSWTLIVPGVLTPGEEKWLHKNCTAEGVAVTWRGETWLDETAARLTHVRNYWFTNEHKLALQLLAEMKLADQLGEAEADSVARRAQGSLAKINEASAYFRYAIATDGHWIRIDATERYPGASEDSGTVLHFEAQNEGAERALQSHRDFGVGFSFEPGDAAVRVEGDVPFKGTHALAGGGPRKVPVDPRVFMRLRLAEPVPRAAGRLTLYSRLGTAGEKGSMLHMSDRFGFMNLRIVFEEGATAKVVTSLHYPAGATASDVLPTAQFVRAANAGSPIMVLTPFDDEEQPADMSIPEDGSEEFLGLIEDWARVEAGCEIDIPFPLEGVTVAQAQEVHEVASLLQGETIPIEFDTITVPLSNSEFGANVVAAVEKHGPTMRWAFAQQSPVSVLGHSVRVHKAVYIPSGAVLNLDELRSGSTNSLQIGPGTDRTAYVMPTTALRMVGLLLDEQGNQVESDE